MCHLDITKINSFLVGIVLAVKGMEDPKKPGEFIVQSICFPELGVPQSLDSTPDRY